MNRTKLKIQLVKHEGIALKPYRCPAGKLTIGVGRNLDDVGLSPEETKALGLDTGRSLDDGITHKEAMMLLEKDIDEAIAGARAVIGPDVFDSLDEVRQRVLVDMAFNLGVPKLSKFVRTLNAIRQRDFARAAEYMLQSKWAAQVKRRAQTLARMMRDGKE